MFHHWIFLLIAIPVVVVALVVSKAPKRMPGATKGWSFVFLLLGCAYLEWAVCHTLRSLSVFQQRLPASYPFSGWILLIMVVLAFVWLKGVIMPFWRHQVLTTASFIHLDSAVLADEVD